ncbi:hypothetical protein L596_021966 [Steinernema carpocapsae]|uniref:F-box domain-containing protein n=1 Tax=Steinernema carpocapsae TaxID=34508 RepID=A0A4U5ML63_STECR|nr:hypothetical protein L596_021966 [Steinernema carpocapsae]
MNNVPYEFTRNVSQLLRSYPDKDLTNLQEVSQLWKTASESTQKCVLKLNLFYVSRQDGFRFYCEQQDCHVILRGPLDMESIKSQWNRIEIGTISVRQESDFFHSNWPLLDDQTVPRTKTIAAYFGIPQEARILIDKATRRGTLTKMWFSKVTIQATFLQSVTNWMRSTSFDFLHLNFEDQSTKNAKIAFKKIMKMGKELLRKKKKVRVGMSRECYKDYRGFPLAFFADDPNILELAITGIKS